METKKKPKFDAFHSNSMLKSSSKYSSQSNGTNVTKTDTPTSSSHTSYDFEELWRGSVSNLLMSSDNLTEDLIKDSIAELENAMQESKRMLHERDDEIQKLRQQMDKMTADKEIEDDEKYATILKDYRGTQERVMELECEIRQLKAKEEANKLGVQGKGSGCENGRGTGDEENCHCGDGCQAVLDLNETKMKLEVVKTKYDNLKRKVRQFRKQIQLEQDDEKSFNMEGKNISSCTLQ